MSKLAEVRERHESYRAHNEAIAECYGQASESYIDIAFLLSLLDEFEALPGKIVERLFALGADGPKNKIQRIQFMGGTYPDNEIPQGGMCKTALITFIDEELRAIIARGAE